MNFTIVTGKTVPCTSCGKRIKINKAASINDHGHRVFELKCKDCGALCEYDGQLVDDVIAGKVSI